MALFNCVGKTSAFIGPFISSAIIAKAGGNTNAAYYFLLPFGLLGLAVLCLVDTDKAKIDSALCTSAFFLPVALLTRRSPRERVPGSLRSHGSDGKGHPRCPGGSGHARPLIHEPPCRVTDTLAKSTGYR